MGGRGRSRRIVDVWGQSGLSRENISKNLEQNQTTKKPRTYRMNIYPAPRRNLFFWTLLLTFCALHKEWDSLCFSLVWCSLCGLWLHLTPCLLLPQCWALRSASSHLASAWLFLSFKNDIVGKRLTVHDTIGPWVCVLSWILLLLF